MASCMALLHNGFSLNSWLARPASKERGQISSFYALQKSFPWKLDQDPSALVIYAAVL